MLNAALRRIRPSLWFALALLPGVATAELIFTSPPRGSEAAERALYEPVARAMSEWLGTKVTYEFPRDFTSYSFLMRGGRYDIVFDGPHFAAWRAANLQHKILVNLPENLAFVVLTSNDNERITEVEDLVANKVCGQAPPHLGTLFLMSQFPNPAREPIIQRVDGEARIFELLKSGECRTAILGDKIFKKMGDSERAKYRILFTSRPVPNNAISASAKVTPEQQKILIERLTNPKTAAVAKPLFDRFSPAAKSFETAHPERYEGLDLMLKDLSFGW